VIRDRHVLRLRGSCSPAARSRRGWPRGWYQSHRRESVSPSVGPSLARKAKYARQPSDWYLAGSRTQPFRRGLRDEAHAGSAPRHSSGRNSIWVTGSSPRRAPRSCGDRSTRQWGPCLWLESRAQRVEGVVHRGAVGQSCCEGHFVSDPEVLATEGQVEPHGLEGALADGWPQVRWCRAVSHSDTPTGRWLPGSSSARSRTSVG
jgi:hypothetical protein